VAWLPERRHLGFPGSHLPAHEQPLVQGSSVEPQELDEVPHAEKDYDSLLAAVTHIDSYEPSLESI